jgi:hypothetical protein
VRDVAVPTMPSVVLACLSLDKVIVQLLPGTELAPSPTPGMCGRRIQRSPNGATSGPALSLHPRAPQRYGLTAWVICNEPSP